MLKKLFHWFLYFFCVSFPAIFMTAMIYMCNGKLPEYLIGGGIFLIMSILKEFLNKSTDSEELYKPVDFEEFSLIRESNFTKFPPRKGNQPFFYPIVDYKSACKVAQDLVNYNEIAIMVSFRINKRYIKQFVPNYKYSPPYELIVPAERLVEFNTYIDGTIEIVDVIVG